MDRYSDIGQYENVMMSSSKNHTCYIYKRIGGDYYDDFRSEFKRLPAQEKEEKIKKLEQQIKELEEQKKRMKKKESQNDDSMKGNSENKATDERVGNNIDIQA